MPQLLHTHTFDNGLTLLAESMDWLESVAFAMLLPAGYVYDPAEQLGLSSFTCEMVQRGCGPRDSRQFVEDLDRLGVDRSASVSSRHTSYGGAMLSENLGGALAIYADMVRAPQLPKTQLEDGRQVCLQELWALEDDLPQKMMLRLKERHYGDPWGRPSQGTFAAQEQITLDYIRRFWQTHYHPREAILSVAGKLDCPGCRIKSASCLATGRATSRRWSRSCPLRVATTTCRLTRARLRLGSVFAASLTRTPTTIRCGERSGCSATG